MTGSIEVLAPFADVVAILRSMRGASLTEVQADMRAGIAFLQSDVPRNLLVQNAGPLIAYGEQEYGTLISVADFNDKLEFEVYKFLMTHSNWNMYLTDDFSNLIDWRGPRPYGSDGLDLAPNARRSA